MLKYTSIHARSNRCRCLAVVGLLFVLAAIPAVANDGKVTFLNGAQKAGTVNVTIHYTDGGVKNSCSVLGSSTHAVGTSPADKAAILAADIKAQCVNVSATQDPAGSGSVKVSSVGADVSITEIDVSDRTGQKKTINPQNLDDGKMYASIFISGLGGSGALASVSLDGCGSVAFAPTVDRTGAEVASDLVDGLFNCDEGSGSSISFVNWGGDMGEIRFVALSNANSTITFDPGEESGLEDTFNVGNSADANGGTPPSCGLEGEACTSDADCCSGTCRGKPGAKACT